VWIFLTIFYCFKRFATRTRKKVGRAFSFNKTPSKLKRAVSTVMSPFGSSLGNVTPSLQLEQMRLASCTSLASVASLAVSIITLKLIAKRTIYFIFYLHVIFISLCALGSYLIYQLSRLK
jgi:hypothetical protein